MPAWARERAPHGAGKGADMADQGDETTATDPENATAGTAAQQPREPGRDWKAEYDKLLEQSRKWEGRAKSNAEKAKAYDEAQAKSMTDAERADRAEKRAEDAEAKLAAYEKAAERTAIVSEVSEAKGVDAELLARMSGDSREEVEANADFIAERMAGASIYPSVSDGGRTAASPITREEIEAIRDPRERVRMRAKHIDLYR